MEIDDFALVGFAHPHVVNVADDAGFRRKLGQRDLDGLDPLGRSLAARCFLRLQGLDVGLDFGIDAEFGGDRVFKAVGQIVSGAER